MDSVEWSEDENDMQQGIWEQPWDIFEDEDARGALGTNISGGLELATKMKWEQGDALGKEKNCILAPIKIHIQEKLVGLGYNSVYSD